MVGMGDPWWDLRLQDLQERNQSRDSEIRAVRRALEILDGRGVNPRAIRGWIRLAKSAMTQGRNVSLVEVFDEMDACRVTEAQAVALLQIAERTCGFQTDEIRLAIGGRAAFRSCVRFREPPVRSASGSSGSTVASRRFARGILRSKPLFGSGGFQHNEANRVGRLVGEAGVEDARSGQ